MGRCGVYVVPRLAAVGIVMTNTVGGLGCGVQLPSHNSTSFAVETAQAVSRVPA